MNSMNVDEDCLVYPASLVENEYSRLKVKRDGDEEMITKPRRQKRFSFSSSMGQHDPQEESIVSVERNRSTSSGGDELNSSHRRRRNSDGNTEDEKQAGGRNHNMRRFSFTSVENFARMRRRRSRKGYGCNVLDTFEEDVQCNPSSLSIKVDTKSKLSRCDSLTMIRPQLGEACFKQRQKHPLEGTGKDLL